MTDWREDMSEQEQATFYEAHKDDPDVWEQHAEPPDPPRTRPLRSIRPGGRIVWSEGSARFSGTSATYDPSVDALYLSLRPDVAPVAETRCVSTHINADLAGDGTLLGFEILGVTRLPRPDSRDDGRDREADTDGI